MQLHPPKGGQKRYFLTVAYFRAVVEDIRLILYAFENFLKNRDNGWLKLTAFGMGFFAELPGYRSLSHILEPIFIKAVSTVIESVQFPHIQVIEFPNFSGTYTHPHTNTSIKLITTNKEDLLFVDGRHFGYVVGVVNPSDVFSYKGNEFGYTSVESEIGNNTDIRYRQTLLFNPNLPNYMIKY